MLVDDGPGSANGCTVNVILVSLVSNCIRQECGAVNKSLLMLGCGVRDLDHGRMSRDLS